MATCLEVSKVREELDGALAEVSELKKRSDDEASADEQTQQGEDDLDDAEDGGGIQSDIIRGSTSDEGDQ